MDFRENRLVFQEAPGPVPAGDAHSAQPQGEDPEQGGDSYEPLRNYYDAEKYTYYDEVGNPSSMSPEEAAVRGISTVQQTSDEEAAPDAAERTEITAEAKAKLVELDTATGLSALKDAMKEDFQAVVDILNGKDLKGTINKGQLAEDLTFLGGYEAFLEAIKSKLTDQDLAKLREALAKVFDLTGLEDDGKFKEFLANLAAVASNDLFKSELEKQYPHIFTFENFKPDGCALMYDLNFEGENVTLKFSLPSGFQQLYEQHAATKEAEVKAAADEKTKADEDAAKAADREKTRGEIIDEMKKHPIGGLFVDFFGTAPEGQKSMLDKLIDGEAKFLALLLGAIGVPYFAEKYDSARKMAEKHPRLKKVFDEVDARVKPLRVEVEPEAAAAAAPAEAPKFPQMNKGKFAEVIERREVPETGVQLSEDYLVATDKKLKVDLRAGSLILPAGTSLNIDGQSTPDAVGGDDREFKETELVLVKAIPKGTIFTKGVKLELVSV